MGSKISIGLVYKNISEEKFKFYLKRILKEFVGEGYVKDYYVSLDEIGEGWIEQEINKKEMDESDIELIINNYYSRINLMSDVINLNMKEITISLEKTKEYFCFLIDFEESDLAKSLDLNELENKIIDFVLAKYVIFEFDYAFCDNEAEAYSPEIIKKDEELYSLLFIPTIDKDSNKVVVKKSSWYIDGLTSR